MSAFGAGLGGRVEQGAAAVAVSPHALDGLLEDELLLRRPRGLGDLQTILLRPLGDYVDGCVVAINLLWVGTLTSRLDDCGWLCSLL